MYMHVYVSALVSVTLWGIPVRMSENKPTSRPPHTIDHFPTVSEKYSHHLSYTYMYHGFVSSMCFDMLICSAILVCFSVMPPPCSWGGKLELPCLPFGISVFLSVRLSVWFCLEHFSVSFRWIFIKLCILMIRYCASVISIFVTWLMKKLLQFLHFRSFLFRFVIDCRELNSS